jgi:hypothetical protein
MASRLDNRCVAPVSQPTIEFVLFAPGISNHSPYNKVWTWHPRAGIEAFPNLGIFKLLFDPLGKLLVRDLLFGVDDS